MKKKKGFTLIELLVVIAIIALLLSILMPSLRKVKQIARDVVCRSNLKQWSLIWAMYTGNNDSKFPCEADNTLGANFVRGEWIIALRSEWQTEGGITKCPSASKYKNFANNQKYGSYTSTYLMGGTNNTNIVEDCSYGMNNWAYSQSRNTNGGGFGGLPGDRGNFWRSINVRSSSNVPLFMDALWRGGCPDYTGNDAITMYPTESDTNYWDDRTYQGGIRQFAMPRHGAGAKGGTNVLFFDLSARHVQIKEMWTLKWHRNFDTNEYRNQLTTIWPGHGSGGWMDKYANP